MVWRNKMFLLNKEFRNKVSRFFREEEGQGLTEYVLIVGLISLVIIIVADGTAIAIQNAYIDIAAKIRTVLS